MKKVKKVLLVDDSRATNFFNKTILQKTEQIEEIFVEENGKDALELLKSGIIPDIIFLDINMPVMNGWDFLSEFQKLEDQYKRSIIILMIGAALSAEDQQKVKTYSQIKGFEEKMLTKKAIDLAISKVPNASFVTS